MTPTEQDRGKATQVHEPSAQLVQLVFVGTLLFIVLSVAAEYGLGEFAGLNIGQDFGVILGGTIGFGLALGLVAGVIHRMKHRSRRF